MKRRLAALCGERGATTVLVALLLPVLLGFQALTVDVSRLLLERRALQNAADAAALAGAAFLPATTAAAAGEARSAAQSESVLDGFSVALEDVSISDAETDSDLIEVTVRSDVSFAFARTIGIASAAVTAQAAAQIGQLSAASAVLPLGVVAGSSGIDMGTRYCLVPSGGSNSGCSSAPRRTFYGMVIDGGSQSSATYRSRIATGSLTTVHVDDVRRVVSSGVGNATRQGFSTRIGNNHQDYEDVVSASTGCNNGHSVCRYQVLDWRSPRLGVVPIVTYDPDDREVLVRAFAVLFVDSVTSNGAVLGYFSAVVVPGGAWMPLDGGGGGGDDDDDNDSDDYGAHAVRLVR